MAITFIDLGCKSLIEKGTLDTDPYFEKKVGSGQNISIQNPSCIMLESNSFLPRLYI